MPHDTRKSDVWSLGVTFFEILVGRTPFEYEEGEVFEKKEDLEKYWERTVSHMHGLLYCRFICALGFISRCVVNGWATIQCPSKQNISSSAWSSPMLICGAPLQISCLTLIGKDHLSLQMSKPSIVSTAYLCWEDFNL